MNNPPAIIGNAALKAYLIFPESGRFGSNTLHIVGGRQLNEFSALAICQYPSEGGFYLFYCDRNWKELTDTYHETIEGAIGQAEFEFGTTEADWIHISN